MRTCQREGCLDETGQRTQFEPDHPRRLYCSPDCYRLVHNERQKVYNQRLRERRKEARKHRGEARETPPRKKRTRGSHSARWYELQAALVKHGLI